MGLKEFLYFSIYERKNNGFIYNLGTYSNKGSEGLVEGSSDREAAMETLTSSVGAKLINYHITRVFMTLLCKQKLKVLIKLSNEFKGKGCRYSK